MNRYQRKHGRIPKNGDIEDVKQAMSPKIHNEIEEVLPPRSRRELKGRTISRCCYTTPEHHSFGHMTLDSNSLGENFLAEQYGVVLSDLATLAQMQKLKSALCSVNQPKVESASQYSKHLESIQLVDTGDGLPWEEVDNVNEIDEFLVRDEETLTQYHSLSKNCRISDVPRVKIIAEKFTKYKKNNIELRKLEEKVVCVEYDVFDDDAEDKSKPVQKMRAFFSIKPINDKNEENVLTEMPQLIKSKFNVSTGDMQKLNQKEIEIVDGEILENRPYLEDLRKILRRRQKSAKKCSNTINLQTLYEIAKRELLENGTDFDSNTFSKEEMLEVQNLILENCKSSVHGIRRRTVGSMSKVSDVGEESYTENTISRSLLTELLRVDGL